MSHEAEKKKIKSEVSFLNNLLHQWDPIMSGSEIHTPLDEYECLTHKIISRLYSGVDCDGLFELISQEFNSHFGINVSKQEIAKYTNEIWSWWQKKTSPPT